MITKAANERGGIRRRPCPGVPSLLACLALAAACRSPSAAPTMQAAVATLPNSWTIFASDGTVVGLDPKGLPRWTTKMPKKDRITTPIAAAADGTSYLRGRGMLHALGADGKWRWSKKVAALPAQLPPQHTPIYAPIAMTDSTPAMMTDREELTAFSREGDVRWRRSIAGAVVAPPMCAPNGQVIVPTTTGIFAISHVGHVDWRAAPKL